MDRRLIVLVGLVLAVAGLRWAPALAQSPAAQTPATTPEPLTDPIPPSGPGSSALPPAAALPPVEAPPPPSEPATTPATPAEAPRDLQLERSQLPAIGAMTPAAGAKKSPGNAGPLPVASEPPGGKGDAGAAESAAIETDPYVLPPGRLPIGRQAVGLTVDVVAPQVLNINQVGTLKIAVRNTGTSDAMGVVVRDALPEGLEFLSSQPEAERSDKLLFWKLATVPAGSAREILLKVRPIKVGPFDHAATVTMLAGGRSRTIVREPKLKVEQTATPSKVLKGQTVQFRIAVSNPGDGVARNVLVRARLSPGLRVDASETSEQNLFELKPFNLGPGDREELDVLVADAVLGGEQTCEVDAHSDDVTTSGEDVRSIATVNVVEPLLKMTVAGDERRYTDTIATYTITLENPGSATAHNVRMSATLPLNGRLEGLPPGGTRWDSSSGKLLWTIPQIEPGEKEKVALTFHVRLGGVGIYKVTAAARADGGLVANGLTNTEVEGLADIEFEVLGRTRVLDVNDTTMFRVRLKNVGTKEATKILVTATFSKNLKPIQTSGNDDREAMFKEGLLVFPKIDRLARNQEMILGIKVEAIDKGLGTCRVGLVHDGLVQDEKIEDMATVQITSPRP